MTCIVWVYNKIWIAFAADSAATVWGKTFNANKIFSLSKYAPVGIAIYWSAEFMWIPVEILVKEYRKNLWKIKFWTIEDYMSNFINFLETYTQFTVENEELKVEEIIYLFLNFLHDRIAEKVRERFKQDDSIDTLQIWEVTSTEIQNFKNHYEMGMSKYTSIIETSRLEKYFLKLHQIKDQIFQDFLNEDFIFWEEDNLWLESIFQLFFTWYNDFITWMIRCSKTGIVIFWYWEDEIYPWYFSNRLIARVWWRLFFSKENSKSWNDPISWIIPFAQSEPIFTSILWISEEYTNGFRSIIDQLFKDNFLDDTKKDKFWSDFLEKINIIKSWYKDSFVNTLSCLSLNEISSVAETLVSLVAFKKKVSRDIETVGGPIDIAVISKWDGLIWIKRKHYFDINLNHQFLDNYFTI